MRESDHWVRWHDDYDDPTSSLGLRLRAVQRRLADILDQAPQGEISLISACAGDGRDVIGVLSTHRRAPDVQALLVEFDLTLATRARTHVANAALAHVVVVEGDASTTTAFTSRVPADVALFCGIFGNVSDEDVHRTITTLPMLLAPGAAVIWTRHTQPPDLTVSIRQWFTDEGFREVAFDTAEGRSFGVGTHVLDRPPDEFSPDRTMFQFVGDGSGAAV